MPVVVVRADADHRDRSAGEGQQPVVAVGRPVVRHLDHVEDRRCAGVVLQRSAAPGARLLVRRRRGAAGSARLPRTVRTTEALLGTEPSWMTPGRPPHVGGEARPREVVAGVQLADGHARGCGPVGDLLPLVTAGPAPATRGSGGRTRPWSTPGRPSTWSAWKWVRTTASTTRTRSRLRQASMRAGSGPTSTTTARPGPVASTSPSPWPDVTGDEPPPGSGQVTTWVGTAAPMASTATTPTGRSGRRRA